MDTLSGRGPQSHLNVMEVLVQEEIERQLQSCPPQVKNYLNKIEIATYALNLLPPLYASSEKGKNHQKMFGRTKYRKEIEAAVRRGIAAVQRDPLRQSIPLTTEVVSELQQAQTALEELKELLEQRGLLDYDVVVWTNLVCVVQRAINKASWGNVNEAPQPKEDIEKLSKHSMYWY